MPRLTLSLVRLSISGLLAASAAAQIQVQEPYPLCAPSIRDASQPGACIQASSVPAYGALLPLGPELFVSASGEVGVGTLTPSCALDVAGDLHAERAAFGNDGAFGPAISWDWIFDFSHTIQDFSTAGTWSGISTWFRMDPAVDLVGPDETWIVGNDQYVYTDSQNDRDIRSLEGTLIWADHFGSGRIEALAGGEMSAHARDGQVDRQLGGFFGSFGDGAASITDNFAVRVGTGHGGFGSITNDHGIYVHSPGGALTNHYGIFLEDQDFGLADSYAIYSRGGTTFLEGDLGVGTDTPTAKLDVNGDFVASGTKSFVEPHPLDPEKEIRFVCLEGNEAGTYFRGTARLEAGVARIAVPQEFALVTEPAALTVQVTALGPGAELWVASRNLAEIEVRGARDVEFDYFVNGVRRGYAGFEVVRERIQRTSAASARGPLPEREERAVPRAVRAGRRSVDR